MTEANKQRIESKTKKAMEAKAKTLEHLQIEYVPIESVRPNKYNPNVQSDHEFDLLCKSIQDNGFTQPIIVTKEDSTIVDGEHRWTAAKVLGFTDIPVVKVTMTPEQMRVATLRHNRARGSEDVGLSAEVLRDLRELGALEYAQDALMMDDVEMSRLLDDIKVHEEFKNEEWSRSWEPSAVGDVDLAQAKANSVMATEFKDASGVAMNIAMTAKAAETVREREKLLNQAKNEEERAFIKRDSQIYRVSLTFAGSEAEVVKKALGERPAERLLELCKSVAG